MRKIYWTRFTNKAANHCLEGIIGPDWKKRVGKSSQRERERERVKHLTRNTVSL